MNQLQDLSTFANVANQHSAWQWYAIADSAQHKSLPAAVCADGNEQRCLMDAPEGSPLAAQAPHLVQLSTPGEVNANWKWIARNGPGLPCVTVIASKLGFGALFSHLQRFTEVLLPDGEDMFFAFWDPAILALLVGQLDDPTLYVKGPVLSLEQRIAFTQGVAGWWYWDRDGGLHSVRIEVETTTTNTTPTKPLATPLQLTQQQVDDLVEASLPDHVLHYVELNQGHLLNNIKPRQRYEVVRENLISAREIKLTAMSDFVNYVCAALIYKDRFQEDQAIKALLNQVRQGDIAFAQALEQMP